MKSLLTILLISSTAFGQCPAGHSFMPSISSNGVVIIADSCLPDADVKSYWAAYFKSLCGEPTLTNYSTYYRIFSGNTWVNDSIGCENRTVYEKKVGSNWIQISKCLWYWDNKSRFKCYGGINNDIQVPCCGHFHKTKPQ